MLDGYNSCHHLVHDQLSSGSNGHFSVLDNPGFIFEHLAWNPRFDNVTRRPGHFRGPSEFLPVAIEEMSFFKGLFSKEKGTFGFLGALSPSKRPKSQKDLFRENEPLK